MDMLFFAKSPSTAPTSLWLSLPGIPTPVSKLCYTHQNTGLLFSTLLWQLILKPRLWASVTFTSESPEAQSMGSILFTEAKPSHCFSNRGWIPPLLSWIWLPTPWIIVVLYTSKYPSADYWLKDLKEVGRCSGLARAPAHDYILTT
jgi:hypothetical protein